MNYEKSNNNHISIFWHLSHYKNLPGALINSRFSDCTVLTGCCTICLTEEFDKNNDEEDSDGGEVELTEKEGVGVYSSASVKSFKIWFNFLSSKIFLGSR